MNADMSYCLWKAVLGRTNKVELKRSEYDSIKRAWKAISIVADIEEQWDVLLRNYIELETDLLNSAVRSMVLSHESYDQMQDVRLGFSRRLSNLLQTCRSYIDQVPHQAKKLKIDGLLDTFAAERSKAYDASLSYRFMEALRNYSQHRGPPIHGASFDARWTKVDDDERGRLRYTTTANVNLDKIREDKEFKKSVLEEIDEQTNILDVATLTREYMERLGAIHDSLRKSLAEPLAQWKEQIRSAIQRYATVNDGEVLGLSVAEFASDGTVNDYTHIFEELLARTEKIAQRNGSLVNLRRRYASGELLPPKQSNRRR